MTELDRELPEGYKMTELGPLPEEWEVVKLGDVAEKMRAGGTPRRGIDQYWGGDIPFVLIEDMTSCDLYLSKTKETITEDGLNNSNAWLVPPNTILLSMYATIGETAINSIPVATNQAILAIIPKDNFNTVFGAYILKYNAQRLIMQNIQSTQKNVNKGIVENFKIPLPPLPEQRKIAAVLSTVQEAKEKTEAVISAAKSLKKSMMSYLFTYGPVPLPDAENISQKETEIGMIPEEWEVVNLSEVINLRRGVSWRKEEANREGIGIPVVGIPNIKENGSIDFSNTYFLNKNISEEKILRMNDILFVSSSGSIKNIGRNVLIREIPQNRFTYASFTFLGRVSSMKVDSEYLFYLLNSRVVDFTKYARRASDGKYNFQLTQFKNEQKIPLPPLPEQEKIASMLSAIDEKIEAEENKKKALEDLFNTLLHNLMTARIRVNHLALDKAELAM